MPPWGHVSLLDLEGCWGFSQAAAAATISMCWRCWSFINGGRWFQQSAGPGRSPKIQAYPCHHSGPQIHTKGNMLACLSPQLSSCCVVNLSQSWGFSSNFTHRVLISWVRTWNPSVAKGAQIQRHRISHIFWKSTSGWRASRAAPRGGSVRIHGGLGMHHVLAHRMPSPIAWAECAELEQVMFPTGGRDVSQAVPTKFRAGVCPNLNWKEPHRPQGDRFNAFRAKHKQIWPV